MTTPAEEMEQIVKEIAVYDEIDYTKYYTIKSFPEICLMKHNFYYVVEILEYYCQNAVVIERFEELIDEFKTRKITTENQTVDLNRKIVFRGIGFSEYVPIHYKNCIFTSPYAVTVTNCENCIVVKE